MKVTTNGVTLEVVDEGRGEPVLLLHGFPDSAALWRHQIPALVEAGYRVIAPDLRGFGESDRPADPEAYAMPVLIADVLGLLAALGVERTAVVGHDWGAGLAWSFAINRVRPLQRLVIMNVPHPAIMVAHLRKSWAQLRKSWYIFFFQLPGIPEWAMTANDARAIRQAFHGMAVDKLNFTDEVLDRYAKDAQRPGAMRGMINWYRAAFRGSRGLTTTEMIETPTLIVWGEEDAALGVELLDGTEAYVRDLTVRRLPGVSHWVQQEAPEKVNAILRDWLPRA